MINELKFDVFEPDSAKWTWDNLYNKTYRTIEYWEKLGCEKKNGKYYEAEFDYQDGNKIIIGCDTIFHFTGTYGSLFRNILGDSYDEKKYTDMNHSILNFSLLPKSGGLNNNKANGAYCDRVDRFVYLVDKYIREQNEKNNPLFNIRGNNRKSLPILKHYLSTIQNVYDFCYYYYLIDSSETNLVDRLLVSGEKYIGGEHTTESCNEYLSIAEDFWNYRKSLFCEKYGLDINRLDDLK